MAMSADLDLERLPTLYAHAVFDRADSTDLGGDLISKKVTKLNVACISFRDMSRCDGRSPGLISPVELVRLGLVDIAYLGGVKVMGGRISEGQAML